MKKLDKNNFNNLELGDIIMIDFSPSKGHEQRGYRPGLIVSDPITQKELNGIVTVVPITNKTTVLSTNIIGKFDYSPTLKDKTKILKSLVAIVLKADNRETCLEYIEKIQDYIQEDDYYMIFSSKGFSIDILYQYYVYKFTTEKMDLLSNNHGKAINT